MDRIEVNGRGIAFRRAGTGPPLVLLHGAQADSRDWHYQFDAFAPHFTTVAWDAPGCGASDDLPSPGYDLNDLVDDLAGLLDALEITNTHLIGMSLGSIVAIAFHQRRPSAVTSLVLASAYAGWAGSLPQPEVRRRTEQVLRDLDQPDDQAARRLVATLLPGDTPPWIIADQIAMISRARPATTRALVTNMAPVDLRPLLSRIRAPTLLLYGRKDTRAPESVARALHAEIRGSQLVFLPDAGHSGHIQMPDQWNRAVSDFLRCQPRPRTEP